MQEEIVVEVKPDGTVLVYARGMTGSGCVKPVQDIAAVLGVTIEEEHLPEFFQGDAMEPVRSNQRDRNRSS